MNSENTSSVSGNSKGKHLLGINGGRLWLGQDMCNHQKMFPSIDQRVFLETLYSGMHLPDVSCLQAVVYFLARIGRSKYCVWISTPNASTKCSSEAGKEAVREFVIACTCVCYNGKHTASVTVTGLA